MLKKPRNSCTKPRRSVTSTSAAPAVSWQLGKAALVDHCGVKEGNIKLEVFGMGSSVARCPAKSA